EPGSNVASYDVRYDGGLARAPAASTLRRGSTLGLRARDVGHPGVRTGPNNPLAHQTRAVVMQITGNLPEALKSSERAIALDRTSTNPDFYVTGVQVLNALGRAPDAIVLARLGIAKLPADVTSVPIRI